MGDEPTPAFTSQTRREDFFIKLERLLDEYPEIMDRIKRAYEKDPTSSYWSSETGDFNPASPMFRTGVVVLVGHGNMEMWEDISILEPFRQSHYITVGILKTAAEEY